MTPIIAPETMRSARIRRGRLRLTFPPLTRRKISRNNEPIAPLKKARREEESGMYLRKTPTEPRISMEKVIISIDRRKLPPLSFSEDI